MGAQSSLLALTGAITGAANVASGITSKMSENKGIDSQMAEYARKMRDAKLEIARNNAKMSKLRLDKMKKVVGGEK